MRELEYCDYRNTWRVISTGFKEVGTCVYEEAVEVDHLWRGYAYRIMV